MKSFTKLGLALAFVIAAALTSAQAFNNPGSCHRAPHVDISASVIGEFNGGAAGGPAWVGYMVVKIGSQAPKAAAFICRGDEPPTFRDDGSIYGIETYTVIFDDGSGSFQIKCNWGAVPDTTPGLYNIHEAGKITAGTGAYAGLSGSVVIKGSFMIPDPGLNPAAANPNYPPQFIGELHGKLVGVTE